MRRFAAIVICLLLAEGIGAGDGWKLTHYKWGFGGNGYTAAPHTYTPQWLAQRFTYMIAGNADFPQLMDSIYDSCAAHGYPFEFGPYASSQEVNLYEGGAPATSWAARMVDTSHWLYVYASWYMDSIGVSPESLIVHIADDSVNITQQGDGVRGYSLTGLIYPRTRFCYQYWNNLVGDTMYPGGYCWLANGYNEDARNAYAYAFRRRFIEDSSKLVGMGGHMPTAYFMDNQYRDASRLGSYYTINGTSGGATAGLDWVEQAGIQSSVDSGYVYFDSSTMKLDARIQEVLDSTTDANGLTRILGIANIVKANTGHLGKTYPFVNAVSLENCISPTENIGNWRAWYAYADTMSKHPDHYIHWGIPVDNVYSTNLGSWKSDSDRVFLAHMSFFLTVQDTNAYGNIMRFNKIDRWRKIAEIDIGTPDSLAKSIDTTGNRDYVRTPVETYPNDSTYVYTVRRYYNDSNAVVIFITSSGGRWGTHTIDNISESLDVDLGGYYYSISADADTAEATVNTVRLPIYSGFIGISGEAPTDPTISRTPSTFTFTATEGGSNPANQTLSISNSGAGTLDWALTDDAAWLSLGTPNGENTGSSTVIVDISGLDPGDYNATITITDVHATNNPQTATVALHVDAAGGPPDPALKKVWRGRIRH